MRTLMFQLTVLFVAILVSPLQAAEDYSDLMNKAGMQRMLSQRIAKAYFYHGQGIAKQEAEHQLKIALIRFENNSAELKKVKDDAVQQLLAAVQEDFSKYKALAGQPYNKENAAAVLETSETLLEACQNVVLKLEELSGEKMDSIINTS
ncbi:type IV pili methyl-accepting chemotaxis transducer N-terminal domain-containing protein, partial [Desulfobulbus sp. F4]|nr:type IV pili methyl-accepting chemotaxis transducer N-terminal domain-containing protein [Desulfobulbus sp. F4]